jgi:hypothetical protein
MDARGSSGKVLVLPLLPKKHADFDVWEFTARAAVMAACPQDFDAKKMFAHINKESCGEPWTYKVRGSGCEKKMDAFRKINTALWSALLTVMQRAISSESAEQASSLKWKLFYDKMYQDTKKFVPWVSNVGDTFFAPPAGLPRVDEEPGADPGAEGADRTPAPSEATEEFVGRRPETEVRAVTPEFDGAFLWSKMCKHVHDTSKPGKQTAKMQFRNIRIIRDNVLQFFMTVDDVAHEAGYDQDDKFVHIRSCLENHPKFGQIFMTWRLNHPECEDMEALKKYFEDRERDKHDRFKQVSSSAHTGGWGTAAVDGNEETYPQQYHDQDWSGQFVGSYLAAAAQDQDFEEVDLDESPGEPWAAGDQFWDATQDTYQSWATWSQWVPEEHFALAARFKGRKGKPGRGGFRRFTPKGRTGQGKGKGKGSKYGRKGKGVAAPSLEEEWDPFYFYDPNTPSDLACFFWDAENEVPVYDPHQTIPAAAAAVKGRKGKKGKGGQGKGKGGGKPGKSFDPNEPCRQWAEFRCKFNPCRYSHKGKGGHAPEALKGKGVAAQPYQQQPGDWVASGQPQQWQQQQPGDWVASGQPQQWQQASCVGMASGQPQQWQQQQQQTAIVPYQTGATVQRANLMQNVAPEHRAIISQYLRQAQSPAAAAVGTPSNFGPQGPTSGNQGFLM